MKNMDRNGVDECGTRGGQSGQAVVEFAIVFPLQILVTLLIVQITLIMVGKQVVNYAAFTAARAELVGESSLDAASTVCIPIAGTVADLEDEPEVYLPAWDTGKAPHFPLLSRRARSKLRVFVDENVADGNSRTVVRVNFDFEMTLPFVNWVIYYALDAVSPGLVHVKGLEETSGPAPDEELACVIQDTPHIILKEKAVLAAPWANDESGERPHEFISEFDQDDDEP